MAIGARTRPRPENPPSAMEAEKSSCKSSEATGPIWMLPISTFSSRGARTWSPKLAKATAPAKHNDKGPHIQSVHRPDTANQQLTSACPAMSAPKAAHN